MNCVCGKELTGKQIKYCSKKCNADSRAFNGHFYKKKEIVYNKRCHICGQPFDTNSKKKIYCCLDCYKKANKVRNRLHTYKEEDRLYKCPSCGEMKSNKKWCFCDNCKWCHRVSGVNCLTGNEIYF